jgi:hypothetical protein
MYAIITSDDFNLVMRTLREQLPKCSQIAVTRENRHYRMTISEIPDEASSDSQGPEDSSELVQVM